MPRQSQIVSGPRITLGVAPKDNPSAPIYRAEFDLRKVRIRHEAVAGYTTSKLIVTFMDDTNTVITDLIVPPGHTVGLVDASPIIFLASLPVGTSLISFDVIHNDDLKEMLGAKYDLYNLVIA